MSSVHYDVSNGSSFGFYQHLDDKSASSAHTNGYPADNQDMLGEPSSSNEHCFSPAVAIHSIDDMDEYAKLLHARGYPAGVQDLPAEHLLLNEHGSSPVVAMPEIDDMDENAMLHHSCHYDYSEGSQDMFEERLAERRSGAEDAMHDFFAIDDKDDILLPELPPSSTSRPRRRIQRQERGLRRRYNGGQAIFQTPIRAGTYPSHVDSQHLHRTGGIHHDSDRSTVVLEHGHREFVQASNAHVEQDLQESIQPHDSLLSSPLPDTSMSSFSRISIFPSLQGRYR
jgi:hypothetical protein